MFYWCILGGCLCIVYFPCVLFCFSGDFQSCSKPVEKLNEKKCDKGCFHLLWKPSWPTGGTNRNRKLRIPSGIGLENPIIKGEREAEAAGGQTDVGLGRWDELVGARTGDDGAGVLREVVECGGFRPESFRRSSGVVSARRRAETNGGHCVGGYYSLSSAER